MSKKKKQTITVKVNAKPRNFEANQFLVQKGHQVHVRSVRKMSRDSRRTEVFYSSSQWGFSGVSSAMTT
jgi:hypothetical protein